MDPQVRAVLEPAGWGMIFGLVELCQTHLPKRKCFNRWWPPGRPTWIPPSLVHRDSTSSVAIRRPEGLWLSLPIMSVQSILPFEIPPFIPKGGAHHGHGNHHQSQLWFEGLSFWTCYFLQKSGSVIATGSLIVSGEKPIRQNVFGWVVSCTWCVTLFFPTNPQNNQVKLTKSLRAASLPSESAADQRCCGFHGGKVALQSKVFDVLIFDG